MNLDATSSSVLEFDRNFILRSLPQHEKNRLNNKASLITLVHGDILHDIGEEIFYKIFPLDDTVISLVVPMDDGRAIEAASVGREGLVGCVSRQGYLSTFTRAIVQVGGKAIQISNAHLVSDEHDAAPFRNALGRFADFFLASTILNSACNGAHSIEQRCAKWILSIHDRSLSNSMPITQHSIADLIGAQRTYITRILARFRDIGAIETGWRSITVKDRAALQTLSCDCHSRMHRHFSLVFGTSFAREGAMLAFESDNPAGAPTVSPIRK